MNTSPASEEPAESDANADAAHVPAELVGPPTAAGANSASGEPAGGGSASGNPGDDAAASGGAAAHGDAPAGGPPASGGAAASDGAEVRDGTVTPAPTDGAYPATSNGNSTESFGVAWPAVPPPGGPYSTANLPAASDSAVDPAAVAVWTAAPEKTRPAASWSRQIFVGLGVAAVIAALGFPLGWLWSTVAPWLPVQVSGDELFYADPEGEQRAGAESWFILLSLGTGILLAIIVWFALRRYRGSIMVGALAIGSIATGWIAWWFGHNLGRSHALDVARAAKDGAILQFPPDLRIKSPGNVANWHGVPYLGGVILYVAVAAMAVYAILAGFSMSPSLGLSRKAGNKTSEN
ncbi:MAG TPA: hypothetical protein VGJ28_02515 [Micromonosporaceae bacterium]|jgi:hypothetical protein